MIRYIIKHIPSKDEKENTSFFKAVDMIASIIIEVGEFSITLNDMRLISLNNIQHIGLPSYRTKKSKKERYYPITKELRDILEKGLIQTYNNYLDTNVKNYAIDSYNIGTTITPYLKYIPNETDKEENKYLKDALGIFSINIGDELMLNDVVLIKSDKYYIAFPSYRKLNREFNDRFHANNNYTRNLLQETIISEYMKKLESINKNGGGNSWK